MMTLLDFADAVRKHQTKRAATLPEVPAAECTVVEYQSHPRVPCTIVTIYGPTAEAVQVEIDRAMRSVERDGGMATFQGPRRALRGYGAVGEVVDVTTQAGE